MNPANIFFYFLVIFSSLNVLANSSATTSYNADVSMEISRYSFDKRTAGGEAQKIFLEDPKKYLGGNAGVKYRKCKINKKSVSVYKQSDMGKDIINDSWNVGLKVTCTKIEMNTDSVVGDLTVDSSGRHLPKDSEGNSPIETPNNVSRVRSK
ncbi:MAG: hypothetical protein PHY93_17440 [Bacteriovorax sp.]|nr:hypothetical protein [Bacteriovorax sp.]